MKVKDVIAYFNKFDPNKEVIVSTIRNVETPRIFGVAYPLKDISMSVNENNPDKITFWLNAK